MPYPFCAFMASNVAAMLLEWRRYSMPLGQGLNAYAASRTFVLVNH
jgi:hypothetical protein